MKLGLYNQVFYVHRESNFIMSQEDLRSHLNNNEQYYKIKLLERPTMPFNHKEDSNIKEWKYNYNLMEIPIHPDWETVVINDETFSHKELLDLLNGCCYEKLRKKIQCILARRDRLHHENINLPYL